MSARSHLSGRAKKARIARHQPVTATRLPDTERRGQDRRLPVSAAHRDLTAIPAFSASSTVNPVVRDEHAGVPIGRTGWGPGPVTPCAEVSPVTLVRLAEETSEVAHHALADRESGPRSTPAGPPVVR